MQHAFLGMLLICTAGWSAERHSAIDSLRLDMSLDSAHASVLAWAKKFPRHEIVSDDRILLDDSSTSRKTIIEVGTLFSNLKFQIKPIAEESVGVSIEVSNKLPKKHSARFLKNTQAAARQAFGIGTEGTHAYTRKPAGLYLGLSLLNAGVGHAYANYHSFVVEGSPINAIGIGAGDLASIALMFSDDKTLKGVGIGLYTFYKLIALIGLVNINLHNQITDSGYKFHF